MDQGPLVTEQIDAGAAFILDFDKYKPVKAAFWLKENEDSFWYLYITSDQIDDTNITLAYREVIRIGLQMNDPNFDPLRVKVIGGSDPIAQDVVTMQSAYPGTKIPIRRRRVRVGRMYVNEIYIYPTVNVVAGA